MNVRPSLEKDVGYIAMRERAEAAEAERDRLAESYLKAQERLAARVAELETALLEMADRAVDAEAVAHYQTEAANKTLRRMDAAEADHHRLQEELSRYQGIAADIEAERDLLADAARVINGDGAGEFNTRTSALLALRAALARTEQPQGCEYHTIRVKGCRACDALVHTEQP